KRASKSLPFGLALLFFALFLPLRATHAAESQLEWMRTEQLLKKQQRGQSLTSIEQAQLDRALANRAAEAKKGPKPDTGPFDAVPLTEMGQTRYQREDGGLYTGGSNTPPAALLAATTSATARITPLSAEGKPAVDGKVVLLSIGDSATSLEFSRFKQLAEADPGKSTRLILVDGAQASQDSKQIADPKAGYWTNLDARLHDAGVSPLQVQVLWVKVSVAGPSKLGFPDEARNLQDHLATIAFISKQKFPNAQITYFSSPTYAGYAKTRLNTEPSAFESAFAIQWLIQDQLKGDPMLNWEPASGKKAHVPLCLWGPYLWTSGDHGGRKDGMIWSKEDVTADGTHPSPSGQQKVAELLLNFFKTDENARTWFLKAAR
ncbi:MAG TPA: hypothetical protein VK968_14960, partial [Roseimicrobium sp.]|nr:hypothetical protein [Roseimicrobium sp.]